MALSSLLKYLGVVLLCFAGILFLLGLARTRRNTAALSKRKGEYPAPELLRAQLVRRADWYCGGGLAAVALIAFVTSLIGTGRFFTQPSGNTAGAVILIAVVTTIILVIALWVRHVSLLRAVRNLDAGQASRDPGI
jgi:hypothetical protein